MDHVHRRQVPSLIIRCALPTDAVDIAHVHVRSWQQAYRDLLPHDYLSSLDATLPQRIGWWEQSIEAGEPQIRVALIDDRVVGWVSFGASRDKNANPGEGEIMALYVVAEHWGTGVGRALWSHARGYLLDQGFLRVSLWVLSDNQRAVGFYRAAGLLPDPASEQEITRGGVNLREIRYQATL